MSPESSSNFITPPPAAEAPEEVVIPPAPEMITIPDDIQASIDAQRSEEAALQAQALAEQAANTEVIQSIPGVEVPVADSSDFVPYSAESAAAIARNHIIQGQATMERFTPPTPGTPIEEYVPPATPQS